MTDKDRYRADQQLRTAYRHAIADLSRLRQHVRAWTETFTELGRTLALTPDLDADTRLTLPDLALPTADQIRSTLADIVRLNDLVAQLRHDLRDREMAE